jgi:hypothetical protein
LINTTNFFETGEITNFCYNLFQRGVTVDLLRSQIRCGCGFSRPCYWSSGPFQDKNKTEFITFECYSPISLIIGLGIQPYQASWHPGSPTYGSCEVCVEFLLPETSIRQYPPVPSQTYRVNHYIFPGWNNSNNNQQQQQPPQEEETVYYRSNFYPLANLWALQMIYFEQPILFIGNRIRFIFRGAYQRQTIGGADDYYICLQRCKLFGISLKEFSLQSSTASTDENSTSSHHHITSNHSSSSTVASATIAESDITSTIESTPKWQIVCNHQFDVTPIACESSEARLIPRRGIFE